MIKRCKKQFLVVAFTASLSAIAHAHPGAPGHYHPDEVDEFDEVSISESTQVERGFDLGGVIVLLGVASCLAFALTQRDGGIWSDVTSKH